MPRDRGRLGGILMKSVHVLLVAAMVLALSMGIVAEMPRQNPQQPAKPPQSDPDFSGAHKPLFSPEDKVKEANELTKTVAARLPNSSSNAPIPHKNFIDDYVFARMERDHIPHAPLSSDEEFLRRVYLDATGFLPSADKVRSFKKDMDSNKRDKLIDELVGSEEFLDQWAYHWEELLRISNASTHQWNKQWLRVDRPYNEVFFDLVTPTSKFTEGYPTGSSLYDAVSYLSTRCNFWMDPDDY